MRSMIESWLLTATDARVVAAKLDARFGKTLVQLAKAARASERVNSDGRRYRATWRVFCNQVVDLLEAQDMPLGKRRPPPIKVVRAVLASFDVSALCSRWVAEEGLERGLALYCLAQLRELLPGAAPLSVRPRAKVRSRGRYWRAASLIAAATEVPANTPRDDVPAGEVLARVMKLFSLDPAECGRLFGVARQAIQQWQTRGVPTARQAKLMTILSIAELLTRKLQPGILPGVARRPAAAYGGRTMLDMIAADEHDALLEDVRRSFDWSVPA